jgi:hypothetical protein
MRFTVKEGAVIVCSTASVRISDFCSHYGIPEPPIDLTQEEYLVWFMEFIEKKGLSVSFALKEAQERDPQTRKERAREDALFRLMGTRRYRGNRDKLRSCNLCDRKFISIAGTRKCDLCLNKTAEIYGEEVSRYKKAPSRRES